MSNEYISMLLHQSVTFADVTILVEGIERAAGVRILENWQLVVV